MDFLKKWSTEELTAALDEFNALYEKRIIKENNGGMKSPHMFPAWFIVKRLKPKYLVESGVWKGLGTWFFEQASPETQIISIDPAPHFRVYTSPKGIYQTTDFLQSDWSALPKDDTLLFFDDHQNSLERIKHGQKLGFKKIIVEDNYPYQQGDCYTPKKILSKQKYVIDNAGNKTWFDKKDDDYKYFIENVNIYQEMPPIFKDVKTRWNDDWNEENYPTPTPLLSDDNKENYPEFYSEKKNYTWICYLEMK